MSDIEDISGYEDPGAHPDQINKIAGFVEDFIEAGSMGIDDLIESWREDGDQDVIANLANEKQFILQVMQAGHLDAEHLIAALMKSKVLQDYILGQTYDVIEFYMGFDPREWLEDYNEDDEEEEEEE